MVHRLEWNFRVYAKCMQECMQLVFKKIRGSKGNLNKWGVLLPTSSPIYQTLYDFYWSLRVILRVRKSIFLQDFCRRLHAIGILYINYIRRYFEILSLISINAHLVSPFNKSYEQVHNIFKSLNFFTNSFNLFFHHWGSCKLVRF